MSLTWRDVRPPRLRRFGTRRRCAPSPSHRVASSWRWVATARRCASTPWAAIGPAKCFWRSATSTRPPFFASGGHRTGYPASAHPARLPHSCARLSCCRMCHSCQASACFSNLFANLSPEPRWTDRPGMSAAWPLKGSPPPVLLAARSWSASGTLLASGSNDHTLRLQRLRRSGGDKGLLTEASIATPAHRTGPRRARSARPKASQLFCR